MLEAGRRERLAAVVRVVDADRAIHPGDPKRVVGGVGGIENHFQEMRVHRLAVGRLVGEWRPRSAVVLGDVEALLDGLGHVDPIHMGSGLHPDRLVVVIHRDPFR